MLAYYLRLAWLSLRRNPVLSTLMVVGIALGIGVCMTMLTLYHLMGSDPIAYKSSRLFAVQLDNWDPNRAASDDQPEQAPWQLTWRDANALLRSELPLRQAAMFKSGAVVQPAGDAGETDIRPELVLMRVTGSDFFRLFDTPFLYGSGWDRDADAAAEQVVVLNRQMNEKLFGGEDSVGREVRLDDHVFRVVGVLDDWAPTPKYYDVNNGAFDEPEDLYIPFSLAETMQLDSYGNTNCWKDEGVDSFDAFMASECIWIQYWVEFADPAQALAYRDWLDGYVAEQKALGRFERPMNNRVTNVPDWLDAREVVREDTKGLLVLSFMFLIVCLLNTIGILLAKFLGKAPQVSLRRALGATRTAIVSQHMVETAVIGVAGGVAGLGLALLGLAGVNHLYEGYERLVRMDLTLLAAALGLAMASGLVAGLYPTWRLCQTAPAGYLKTQ